MKDLAEFLLRHIDLDLIEQDEADPSRPLLRANQRIVHRILHGDIGMVLADGPEWHEPESEALARDILVALAHPYRNCDGFRPEWREVGR